MNKSLYITLLVAGGLYAVGVLAGDAPGVPLGLPEVPYPDDNPPYDVWVAPPRTPAPASFRTSWRGFRESALDPG